MVVRTAVLEGAFESIDQSAGDSPVWPGGQRYYVYGSLFFKHLMENVSLYGPGPMWDFVEAVAGQWVPYRVNSAARESFGVSFSEAWKEWEAGLEARYQALRDSLASRAPLTQGEPLVNAGYYAWSPEPSPDGRTLAFAQVDGRSDPQLRLQDLSSGEERKLARTNSLSQFSWTPSGSILFSQLRYTDSYRVRGDLFLVDPNGAVRAVTSGARLDHPDVSPGGNRIAAVEEGNGSNRLVTIDLGTGEVRPLGGEDPEELWAYPRWSPDGRFLAASRWRPGAYFDLVILTPEGEVLWEVTQDRAIDNGASWTPDGRWLIWSSDRSGIPNLYAVPVQPETGEPGAELQITNLLGRQGIK
jgi:WD40 repeat protein